MAKPAAAASAWKPFGPDATLNCIELEEKEYPYGKFVYILSAAVAGSVGTIPGEATASRS